MGRCPEFSLYVIVDLRPGMPRPPDELGRMVLDGGADILQLRAKTASGREFFFWGERLRRLTQEYGRPLIINDRLDVALALEADGVHLGQDDLPVACARKVLPEGIIGFSTHSVAEALAAEALAADYLALGPIFPSPSKPGTQAPLGLATIRQAAASLRLPWLAIGGINEGNLPELLSAGARRIAVISAVACAENPYLATRRLKELLETCHPQ